MLMLQHLVRFVKYEHIIECGAVDRAIRCQVVRPDKGMVVVFVESE